MMVSTWSDLPRRLATICIGVPILWSLWLSEFWLRLFWEGTHFVVALEWSTVTKKQPIWLFPMLSTMLVHCTDATMLMGAFLVVNALSQILLTSDATIAITRGITLVSIPFHFWLRIAGNTNHGFHQTVTLLLTVWNCDTGALVAGRLLGGKYIMVRFAPSLHSISPKKSMEGLLGGLVVGAITYAIMPCLWYWLGRHGIPVRHLVRFFEMRRSVGEWTKDLMVGCVLAGAAIIGDLWESSLKRLYNAKDTSKLLPGHGKINVQVQHK